MIKPTSDNVYALEGGFRCFKMKPPLLLARFAQWLAYVRINTQLKLTWSHLTFNVSLSR